MIFKWDWKEEELIHHEGDEQSSATLMFFMLPDTDVECGSEKWLISLRLGPEPFGSRGALIWESQPAKAMNACTRTGHEHVPSSYCVIVNFSTAAVKRYSEAWNAVGLPGKVDQASILQGFPSVSLNFAWWKIYISPSRHRLLQRRLTG